ncbi:hypothetical protein CHS0354_024473 [Potamilus streckersoni]|uniref:Arsenosugar biosynthesis radical SAM protein ArsS-like C-terminal domain-containing protein n=1 Tax=Potamilus streckersoni TaxID=2493646 RepID=A0AAE0TPU6_9BIVA|nr:hypothetical protein CHS0354_024473 [Potamilus streckersoni]
MLRLRCRCLVKEWSSKVLKYRWYSSKEQPDYNTDVNIHEHKLKRPEGSRKKQIKAWDGLEDLKARTKGSLIPDTLKEMEESEEFQLTVKKLKEMGQAKLTKEERLKRQRALDQLGVPSFLDFWHQKKKEKEKQHEEKVLRKRKVEILQVNIGLYCNQACNHCHVESSPKRIEMMDNSTAERCLYILRNSADIHTLDLTGGAPELCKEFRYLAKGGVDLGRNVIVRTNLTALLEPGQEDTAEFFAEHKLNVVASLPCYSTKNVNLQRGKGVFDKSIQALLVLNSLGYSKEGTGLKLDLVYNPLGAFLPPPQKSLEEKYKEELKSAFGIEFNNLFTITNMPIKRFADFLHRRSELNTYMELLVRNYNLDTIDVLMCRNLLNVNWNGQLYDCDFNQQLDMGIPTKSKQGIMTVWDIESASDIEGQTITVDNHCYGCTAGMGSS